MFAHLCRGDRRERMSTCYYDCSESKVAIITRQLSDFGRKYQVHHVVLLFSILHGEISPLRSQNNLTATRWSAIESNLSGRKSDLYELFELHQSDGPN